MSEVFLGGPVLYFEDVIVVQEAKIGCRVGLLYKYDLFL